MPPDRDRDEDHLFDAIYPAPIRRASRRFWTPVAVARRAAALFRDAGARRVLDVGAGVGKFVLAAAASAPTIHFVGMEHRVHLVDVARCCRCKLRISNAHFLVGDVTAVRWRAFDGLYFFNPLAENLLSVEDRIDGQVELTAARFVHDVAGVEDALRSARVGSVVVTYHGSSTRMPGSYELKHAERAGSDWLRVWVKERATDNGAFFWELDDSIVWCPAARGIV
jgi:hypothetical protein